MNAQTHTSSSTISFLHLGLAWSCFLLGSLGHLAMQPSWKRRGREEEEERTNWRCGATEDWQYKIDKRSMWYNFSMQVSINSRGLCSLLLPQIRGRQEHLIVWNNTNTYSIQTFLVPVFLGDFEGCQVGSWIEQTSLDSKKVNNALQNKNVILIETWEYFDT